MPTGFIVLADMPGADAVARQAPLREPRTLRHPSGRPWLLGGWAPWELTTVTVGALRVVVAGVCPVTATALGGLAGRIRDLSDADDLARRLPGSFYLLVSLNGRVRVQGSASGLRPLFHTQVGEVPVASDRPELLAAMTGASIDEGALATRVVCGLLPPPLGGQSMWSGVRAVPPGDYLAMAAGRTREVRWWQAPAPDLPLAEGAAGLREALTTAMTGRFPPGLPVSSDMSGGMDSTSLCFLAARERPGLVTFRWAEAEASNDDKFFASHAAQALPHAHHVVAPQDTLPAMFAEPAAAVVSAGQPHPSSHTVARTRHTARLLAARGSRWHLAGHGGDEAFAASPGYLPGLLRRHPLTAIRHARGYRALYRWHLAGTVAGMAGGGDVAAWWRSQADQLTGAAPSGRSPSLGWGGMSVRAPVWVTPQAAAAVRETLRHAADRAQALAADRGQHQILSAVRASGVIYGQFADIFAEAGVVLDTPYLDDRVLEAALAVRLHERASPWRYKPLLSEAMRGIVPGVVLGRSTKGEFGEDIRIGLRRNLPAVLALVDGSTLAARGLIDPGALRDRLLAPQVDNASVIALENLLACEVWLRTASQAGPPPATTPPVPHQEEQENAAAAPP